MNSLLKTLKERAPDRRTKSETNKGSLLDFLRKRDAELDIKAKRERLSSLARKEVRE